MQGRRVDGGEFSPLIVLFATIPKAKRGGAIDKTKYNYLDAVHMDIVLGNCVSIGGFCYALILTEWATCYNWAFGLKSLSSDSILLAIWFFRAAAGSLAHCFYSNCNLKISKVPSANILLTCNLRSLPLLQASHPMG